jgi:phosphatidylglycerol:prolipoprotein diacylglycerol transferase
MYPILFEIGPFTVYTFGTLVALAALVAGWIARAELKRYGYDPDLASSLVVTAIVGGLIGARLFFVLEDLSGFLSAPLDFIFTGAGFTWHGGLLGGALGITWLARRKDLPWLRVADICAPALALAYGIGRIGCHLAGDGDWGTVTELPWGVAYTNAIIGWVHPVTGVPYPPGVKVHPTPIYEFLQASAVFVVLWSLRKRPYREGTLFWLYLVLAGAMRLVVEFWRVNPIIALGMTEAQWISLILIALGFYMLFPAPALQEKRA